MLNFSSVKNYLRRLVKATGSLTLNRTGAYKQKLKELFPCR